MTRRELMTLIGMLTVGSRSRLSARQQKPAPSKLETVTLIISGMT